MTNQFKLRIALLIAVTIPIVDASAVGISTDTSEPVAVESPNHVDDLDYTAIKSPNRRCNQTCRPAIAPVMLGDGGLITPRLLLNSRGVLGIQNHVYKVAENNSAMPQNRIGFNFNYLSDVYDGSRFGGGGKDLSDILEYRFFMEKTFLSDNLSLDFMIPFYQTSDLNLSSLELSNGRGTATSFGDLAFGIKALMHSDRRSAFSLGLRVEAPTTDQFRLSNDPGIGNITIDNDAWYFTPYIAALLTPSDNLFVQGFLSYRMESGESTREVETPGPSNPAIVIDNEPDCLMADIAIGTWLYRDRCANREDLPV